MAFDNDALHKQSIHQSVSCFELSSMSQQIVDVPLRFNLRKQKTQVVVSQ